MSSKSLYYFCILFHLILAKNVSFKASGGKVLRVDIEECHSEPCSFQRLAETNFSISFISNQNSVNGTLWVMVAYEGFEVPLFNFDPNVCDGKNIQCPIIEGSESLLRHRFEMEDFFPPMHSAMTISLDGDNGIIFRVVIPVLITD